MPPSFDQLSTALSDRYRIERELGQGGMATVYLALEQAHGRQVAIKVLRPEVGAAIGPDRFLREIRIAARLSHPHIVPLLASGQADGQLYYVMPFIEGDTLRARLAREKQLPMETTLGIARQVAAALSYSHAQGVVHRDIKPENIMLSGGIAVVTDFGIATAIEHAGQSPLTEVGFAIGTPTYMSPEQATGTVDGRSDQYSLACVIYEMLGGRPPFHGPTPLAVLARHATAQIPTLRSIRPEVPASVERALSRALAKDPADRYATADEFAAALEAERARPAPVTSQESIAVLPFTDLSREKDQGYLCEGIAEELLDALTRLGTLRVASRTSAFALSGQQLGLQEIGRRLKVRCVLEGAVQAAGERLRISVTLTGADDGFRIWSERYDRAMTDVFEVQDEIARTVVARLLPHLGMAGAPVVAPGIGDLEAYRAYLQGRHYASRRTEADLRRAITAFESALAREPAFALAGAGLSEAWFMLGVYGALAPDEAMPRAKAAAERAIAAGGECPEALAVLGSVRAVYDWDWAGAEADLRRALAQSPGHPAVLHRYAVNCLLPRGRFDEASAALHQALERDPLSLVIAASIGLLHYLEGKTADAVAACRGVLELDPRFGLASYFLGLALLQSEAPAAAIPVLEAAAAATARSAEAVAALGSAYATAGRRDDAERCLTELETAAATRYVSPTMRAQILLGLGQTDQALTCLDQARDRRAAELVWLAVRPTWAPLRTHPGFQTLLRQVGLG